MARILRVLIVSGLFAGNVAMVAHADGETSQPGGNEDATTQDTPSGAVQGLSDAASDTTDGSTTAGQADAGAAEVPNTNLEVIVEGDAGELAEIARASVFVELDNGTEVLAITDSHGRALIKALPRGQVKLQVTAEKWETFGDFYALEKGEETIRITLIKRRH